MLQLLEGEQTSLLPFHFKQVSNVIFHGLPCRVLCVCVCVCVCVCMLTQQGSMSGWKVDLSGGSDGCVCIVTLSASLNKQSLSPCSASFSLQQISPLWCEVALNK